MILHLPLQELKTKRENGELKVFDPIRKKYLHATPEELVRQTWLCFLQEHYSYPLNRMMVEKEVIYNGRLKRFDLVIVDDLGNPLVLAEFKAPNVKLSQSTFNQAAVYNTKLQAKYVLISNGEQHLMARENPGKNSWHFLAKLPSYSDILD